MTWPPPYQPSVSPATRWGVRVLVALSALGCGLACVTFAAWLIGPGRITIGTFAIVVFGSSGFALGFIGGMWVAGKFFQLSKLDVQRLLQ